MKYNIWNKWDPLKVCMLGNNYAPEFFNGIPDRAGDPLKRICEETLEDLEGFKEILQDFGVKVIQPEMDRNERFLDNPHRYPHRYPRGPLQPRDHQLVIGNDAYIAGPDHHAIHTALKSYAPVTNILEANVPCVIGKKFYESIAGADYPSYEDFIQHRKDPSYFKDFVYDELVNDYAAKSELSSANTMIVGNKLIAGLLDTYDRDNYTQSIYEDFPALAQFELQCVPMEGHMDGVYHPIKPGALLSLYDVELYSKTFPGWEVCYLPENSFRQMNKFLQLKEKNGGKWWLAGEEDNDEFTHFVETWLQDWVGYVEETVFDVNVLMLDEYHCCVANPNNEQVNTFLKKHKVEPVYVPWRHKYFWDGGLHCITLDLYREGTQKDYFE